MTRTTWATWAYGAARAPPFSEAYPRGRACALLSSASAVPDDDTTRVSKNSLSALNPAWVDDLRLKYDEILLLRLEHAEHGSDAPPPQPRLQALATRFPGALREIDRLPLSELRHRIARLAAVGAGQPAERWMVAVALFHQLARGALCAKRWMNGEKRTGLAARIAFEAELDRLAFPREAGAWIDHLDAIAAPPGGRLTELVYARVASSLEASLAEAKELVFGERR